MDEPAATAGARDWPLVWIDLEMTGLEPDSCHILEIASVVTDSQLRVLAEGPDLVVHQPDEILDGMNEWCKVHHAASGLVDAVRASQVSLRAAEDATLHFLREYTHPGMSPLCGNSIFLDHRFLHRYMPRLTAFLSEQLVDVSTLKELVRRWYPDQPKPDKADGHRAREDILESIAELALYRRQVLR
jgi:oligoribonuclease